MEGNRKTRSTGKELKNWLNDQPVKKQAELRIAIVRSLTTVNNAPVSWEKVKNWMLGRVYMPSWAFSPLKKLTGIDFAHIAV